jgi:hypothetical protein
LIDAERLLVSRRGADVFPGDGVEVRVLVELALGVVGVAAGDAAARRQSRRQFRRACPPRGGSLGLDDRRGGRRERTIGGRRRRPRRDLRLRGARNPGAVRRRDVRRGGARRRYERLRDMGLAGSGTPALSTDCGDPVARCPQAPRTGEMH